jgi:Ca-activated chloride channel family protein
MLVPSFRKRLARAIGCVCLLTLGFLAAIDVQGQQNSLLPALSSRTRLVPVPVTVTDRDGNFVSGLTAKNFEIIDNGQSQAITFFEQQDTPVTVGLLIDHSGSMGPKLSAVAAAISSFAQSSNPQDQMFVIDFGDTVSIGLFDGQSFTNDPAQIEHAITSVWARGRTALYDAIAEGITHLKLGKWNKRALIIVSDGGDNASHYKLNQIVEMAHGSHAVIYAIGLLSESGQEENPEVLRKLAHDTGGLAFFPGQHDSIAAVSNEIARDLRSQYMLAFEPPEQDGTTAFHKLTIKVHVPGEKKLRVRARAGYTAAQSLGSGSAGRKAAETQDDSP